MCDPILVTLRKMQPHYSQSSRENATPSSGTSPVASYKEVPPPGLCTIRSHGTKLYMYILVSKLCSGTSKNKGRSRRTGTSCIVLEVPLCNMLTSIYNFVPCDWVVQRAHYSQSKGCSSSDLAHDLKEFPRCRLLLQSLRSE